MVRPKKHLGQHFLKDQNIARKIVDMLSGSLPPALVVEVGPGTGVLTGMLLDRWKEKFLALDVDQESIDFLKSSFPLQQQHFVFQDFLAFRPDTALYPSVAVIGNFPYNISSQLFFHMLGLGNQVTEIVCMLQREVARRIASGPGSKEYGILSVLLQSRYRVSYGFTVDEQVFDPPPKVKSGVIRLELDSDKKQICRFVHLQKLVKQGFQMRRKTLRNALKGIGYPPKVADHPTWLDSRAEQLSVSEWEQLTALYEEAAWPGFAG